jgi:hypothetical protein
MVDEELPYPPTSGKRLRTFNLTLRLAQRHHITYVCHRNADLLEAQRAALFFAEHGIAPVVVDHTVPRKSGPSFYLRLAANLASPLPYSVASHRSAALRKTLRELAANQPIDLWHCEWTPYAQALEKKIPRTKNQIPSRAASFWDLVLGSSNLDSQEPHPPVLVMAHNVESLIWQR